MYNVSSTVRIVFFWNLPDLCRLSLKLSNEKPEKSHFDWEWRDFENLMTFWISCIIEYSSWIFDNLSISASLKGWTRSEIRDCGGRIKCARGENKPHQWALDRCPKPKRIMYLYIVVAWKLVCQSDTFWFQLLTLQLHPSWSQHPSD